MSENEKIAKSCVEKDGYKFIIKNITEALDAKDRKYEELQADNDRLKYWKVVAEDSMGSDRHLPDLMFEMQQNINRLEAEIQKAKERGATFARQCDSFQERIESLEKSLREKEELIANNQQNLKLERNGWTKTVMERERQIDVLRKFAQHLKHCEIYKVRWVKGIIQKNSGCDCGLEEALKGAPQRVKYADESHLKPKPSQEKL